jgi:hypothetical protein
MRSHAGVVIGRGRARSFRGSEPTTRGRHFAGADGARSAPFAKQMGFAVSPSVGKHWSVGPDDRLLHLRFYRWGRVVAPDATAGSFMFLEVGANGIRRDHPYAGIRVSLRRPGVPDRHHSRTTLLRHCELAGWLRGKGYVISDWLPEGVEPDWAWNGSLAPWRDTAPDGGIGARASPGRWYSEDVSWPFGSTSAGLPT